MKILAVIGTRPEAIKMAPVINAARQRSDCEMVVCSTGQHRTMLQQVLAYFGVAPDVDLDVMVENQSLAQLTANLLQSLSGCIDSHRPDWILAQGDTTTVLVSSLLAFYSKIPFGHVEAGLRTGDLMRPFPEEFNRRVADVTAQLMFAPTELSRQNLLKEGVPESSVLVTGNTVVDALLEVVGRPYDWGSGDLAGMDLSAPIVLVTAHRRESFGADFEGICHAILELSRQFPETQFVFPVHRNPNVRKPVQAILSGKDNIRLLDPLDYISLVHLMKASTLVLTDSGGIQEEAPSLRVPVLVLRETTERPEGVDAGMVRLVGVDPRTIVEQAHSLLSSEDARKEMMVNVNPYGDGKAAPRILDALCQGVRVPQ